MLRIYLIQDVAVVCRRGLRLQTMKGQANMPSLVVGINLALRPSGVQNEDGRNKKPHVIYGLETSMTLHIQVFLRMMIGSIEKISILRTLEIDYWSETKRYEKGICIYYVPCNKCS